MFQRIAVLATCVVLAAIVAASVGRGPAALGQSNADTPTAGSSGSIRGFQFVEIGKKYGFACGYYSVLGIVKKDVGGGWVVVEQDIGQNKTQLHFINLNVVHDVCAIQ